MQLIDRTLTDPYEKFKDRIVNDFTDGNARPIVDKDRLHVGPGELIEDSGRANACVDLISGFRQQFVIRNPGQIGTATTTTISDEVSCEAPRR